MVGSDYRIVSRRSSCAGIYRQGLVCTPQVLLEANPALDAAIFNQDDVTEALGVTKYEPPAITSHAGKLVGMPDLVSVYDIDGGTELP